VAPGRLVPPRGALFLARSLFYFCSSRGERGRVLQGAEASCPATYRGLGHDFRLSTFFCHRERLSLCTRRHPYCQNDVGHDHRLLGKREQSTPRNSASTLGGNVLDPKDRPEMIGIEVIAACAPRIATLRERDLSRTLGQLVDSENRARPHLQSVQAPARAVPCQLH
jgi:hypothetical protein